MERRQPLPQRYQDVVARVEARRKFVPDTVTLLELRLVELIRSGTCTDVPAVASAINDEVGYSLLSRSEINSWIAAQRGYKHPRLTAYAPGGRRPVEGYGSLRKKSENYQAWLILQELGQGIVCNFRASFFLGFL